MDKKKLYILIGIVMVCALGAEMAGIHLHQGWPLPFGYDIAFGFCGTGFGQYQRHHHCCNYIFH